MLMDDAKRARVVVVCQWLTETVARCATVYMLGRVVFTHSKDLPRDIFEAGAEFVFILHEKFRMTEL